MAENTKLNFHKGSSFSSYVAGDVYFETSTHLIKVATSASAAEVYGGVRSASWNASTKKLSIVNEAGTSFELDFSDVASAEGVSSLLGTLRSDIDALDTTVAEHSTALSNIDAAISAGEAAISQLGDDIEEVAEDASVSLSVASTATDGYLKTYVLTQGSNTIGTIDIPKDLVVQDGEVIVATTETGLTPGRKYLKLVIANKADTPVYIDVADLCDVYTAAGSAAQVQIAISSTNEISATVVAGSIGTTELSSAVNVSLGKADTAVQSVNGKTGAAVVITGEDIKIDASSNTTIKEAINQAMSGGVTSIGGASGIVNLRSGSSTVGDVNFSVDGSVGGTIKATVVLGDYDEAGAAATAKSEVIGASGDASTASTIYGAKAYADAKDTAVKSELVGAATDASTASTIYGAKAYADAVAENAQLKWAEFN